MTLFLLLIYRHKTSIIIILSYILLCTIINIFLVILKLLFIILLLLFIHKGTAFVHIVIIK